MPDRLFMKWGKPCDKFPQLYEFYQVCQEKSLARRLLLQTGNTRKQPDSKV